MDSYSNKFEIEKLYLSKIKLVIKEQLDKESRKSANKKNDLVAARKDMYENTNHSSNDFDKLSEAVQYLRPLEVQTNAYEATKDRIKRFTKMLRAPYFARIDFIEEGYDLESIYIGLGNLTDDKTRQIYVCDWRAPISSIFYRYALGEASYLAPYGTIKGKVTLKRQYEIKNSELQYFIDSSVTIMDNMLKQALSQNTSTKMKNIVETIQREQDIIIRDIESDLLIVQGVAGSGKTSVALHRVAFLMYHGVTAGLNTNNIILITPNNLFGGYIENVLPELGEKNIQTITLEEMFDNAFEDKIKIKKRNSLIEEIISTTDIDRRALIKSCMEFKLSKNFIIILDRYLKYFEHRMLEFSDIFYNGECIVNRHLIKDDLLKYNDISMPLEKRLSIIESRIMTKIQEMRKQRLEKLENFISNYPEHIHEIKSYARLLSLKQSAVLKKVIYKFTRIDVMKMYQALIKDKNLFYKLAQGLKLPENIEQILDCTYDSLQSQTLNYEDGMAILCLKLKTYGCNLYKDIKQVVVDEAQDYYPLQYEILKKTFPDTKFTIMGDVNQTIEKDADLSIYDDIKLILNKKRCSTVFMKKSFRCSYEINSFSSNFANQVIDIENFDRHESEPKVVSAIDYAHLEAEIIDEVLECQRLGYVSIALICKSMSEAETLFKNVGHKIGATIINSYSFDTVTGVTILPVYMAKGLEFDAVIIYQTNQDNYNNIDDKKLLYIACTRALHKLSLFYTGEISGFIPKEEK